MACAACGGSRPSVSIEQMVQNVGGSVLPYLKFAYCAYKDQFVQLFAAQGITINSESQLNALADISNDGSDMQGIVKDVNGNPIKFSVINTLNSINTNLAPTSTNCAVS